MRTFLILLIIFSLLVPISFIPTPARAVGATCNFPGCFGGVAVSQILCTCSGNFLTWFTPLYLYGNPAPMSGPLVFQPGTMKYLYYNILPTEGVVGTYVPGVQACWMWTGTHCVPIPNLGLILPDTGASLPGGGLVGMGGVTGALGAGGLIGGLGGTGGEGGGGTGGTQGTQNPPGPVNYSGRLVITKGGTYTGNWESTDAHYPAVDVRTSEPVIIKNSSIRSKGTLIKADGVTANITVLNSYGYGENPDVDMKVPGRFLFVGGFTKVVVLNNYMENTRGIDIHGPKSGSGVIRINNNNVKNIDGRLSGGPNIWRSEDIDTYDNNSSSIDVGDLYGQFVQLNGVKNAHVEIGWNQIINNPYESRSEDVMSIYKSSGTSADPIDIHDNYIQGSYPRNPKRDVFSGGGIMTADDAGSGNVVARNNTVVATTNYGISASAGSNIKITNNRIVTSSKLPDGSAIKWNSSGGNVGIAIFQNYSSALSNVSASNNTVGWTKADGNRNDWYVPDASSFTGNKHYSGDTITQANESNEFTLWQQKLTANGTLVGPVSQ